jgi:hypothetical protein
MSDYSVLENLSFIIHLFVLFASLRTLPALRRAGEHAAVASVVGIAAASLLGAALYFAGGLRDVFAVLEAPTDALLPLFHLAVACVLYLAVKALSNFQHQKGRASHEGNGLL